MHEQAYSHRAVLLREALDGLNLRDDGTYVDGTFGRGGHARAILDRLGDQGRLLAIDKDPEAVRAASEELGQDSRFTIVQGSFAMLEQLMINHDLVGRVNGVLLDLGVSSPQLEDPARGFSFSREGPLDMRMDPAAGISASEWLAGVPEAELSEVLRSLGEERFHRRIARAIVREREESPITTTRQLAELVERAVPGREKHKHPATRTFQAIRIYINSELEDLSACLEQAVRVLAVGGRLVVISFHSLEDRIVKRFIRQEARGEDIFPPDMPVRYAEVVTRLRSIGKAVRPGDEEVAQNPRARSAVMRVAERTA